MLEWIILNFDAFELIEKGLQEELAKQGFSEAVPLEDPAGRAVMFTTEDVAYSLLYERAHQRFQLRSTTLKEAVSPGIGAAFPFGFLMSGRARGPTRRAFSMTF